MENAIDVRLAELMAALSVAVDLGLGDTVEHAQRSAVISVALSEAAGLTAEQAHDAYYLSLLQTVGCTGDHDFAFGNRRGHGGLDRPGGDRRSHRDDGRHGPQRRTRDRPP